jgi:hypothetical protein
LLAGDLEQQRAVYIHRWQLGHPCPRIEGGPVVDEPGQHGIGVAEVATAFGREDRILIPVSRCAEHKKSLS